MAGSFSSSAAFPGRRRGGARIIAGVGRRTLMESLYLFTAPVTAAVGLVLIIVALCARVISSFSPNDRPVAAWSREMARWPGDIEWWRIDKVRPSANRSPRSTRQPRREGHSPDSPPDARLRFDLVHAVLVLPLVLVTSLVTALWWWFAVALVTFPLRNSVTPESLHPMALYAGSAQPHIALSLGLTSPDQRITFALTLGLSLLAALPLVTRACVAAQAGLGRLLLSNTSALHPRIGGLSQERDHARAQPVATVTAEADADALRRLERDIHDGPQQRLVGLALELGRAQHLLDRRPQAVREALADAIVQTREALDELRALSRGIAPPILADRGLCEALAVLAARCPVPVEFDAGPVNRRPRAAVEAAAYFVVAEALTNVAKHSRARRCTIGMRHDEETLRVWVTDDGVGGAACAKGHGLQGLDDRIQALGGRLHVLSPEGGPTTITAELPCR